MRRVMVYSHDTYGMGNIRRMLAISRHLIDSFRDLSILLVTGSPVIQDLRLPQRLDYIKLPCLTRTAADDYSAKSLGMEIGDTIRLRSDLIRSAVVNYRPHVALIDKKPTGVKQELVPALEYMKNSLPSSRLALVLRDILDSPERTIRSWEKHGHYDVVRSWYDLVLILGSPDIFDARLEYRFPAAVAEKTRFCGYIHHAPVKPMDCRRQFGLKPEEKLVLVTTGGGEDGFKIVAAYLAGQERLQARRSIHSLILCGPEMPESHRTALHRMAGTNAKIHFGVFTHDLVRYMDAADAVVAMGGYNTICELLSLEKPAVIIPRARPVQEQAIRVALMSKQGWFKMIHPDQLTPEALAAALLDELENGGARRADASPLDFNALPRVAGFVAGLLQSQRAHSRVLRLERGNLKSIVAEKV